MTFIEQLDYYSKLSAQIPPKPLRVLFAASGTLPAAVVLRDEEAIVEHALYWAAVNETEANYLVGILNSEALRLRIANLQARGQWGARHFDKLVFEQPIPRFDPESPLHRDLSEAAHHAEEIAAAVQIREGMYFVRVRRVIRDALQEEGIARRIDELVTRLLDD